MIGYWMGGAGIFPVFPNKIPEISRIPATPTDDYEKKKWEED